MNRHIFDCDSCLTKCDGKSKSVYIFKNDVDYSEYKENKMIAQINTVNDFAAKKCELDGYPDIEILHKPTGKIFYVEIKAQRRTFMSVKRILPNSGLEPSETLALNLSDLLRYFKIRETNIKPIFILWCLENRPCVVAEGKTRYFYQDTMTLEKIYNRVGDRRRFRRESGYGDVVNGQHKGVVVNYHFSIDELEELHILDLLQRGIGL